jgi:2',3'-cyclic-nucleotide 2'-phosphodiesterase (5'-nucleotidase family)
MTNDGLSRRSLLKCLGVTGVAATIAGCPSDSDDTLGTVGDGGDDTPTETVTLLHDTHVGGRLGPAEADDNENIESYFGLMDQLTESGRTLRLGVGDDLGSSALSTEFEGKHIVDPFEVGNLSHDTFGNHDFDFGPDVLRTRVSETEGFQWVSANTDEPSGEVFASAEGAKRFDTVELAEAEVSVGITGVLTPRAEEVTTLGDAVVRNPTDALKQVVPEMRDAGADVVVVLSHVSNDRAREKIAPNVDGIDVLVGDDAAEKFDDIVDINDTVLSFVGDEYDFLGEVTLDVEEGTVRSVDRGVYDVSEESIQPNESVKQEADSYRNQVDSTVIGESTVQLNCVSEDLRTGETNMGNFVSDAIRADLDSDIAIQNGGGIRTNTLYSPGDITDFLIRQILPFGNVTVELEVSGQTLHDALENGVSQVDSLEGRFPQVSGMTFDWAPDASSGDRIAPADVTIGDSPLDIDDTYTLGTNGFMADGGDGYEMLASASQTDNGGTEFAQLVIDRIQDQTPISPETEGRIEQI